jgi:hypothetical protein
VVAHTAGKSSNARGLGLALGLALLGGPYAAAAPPRTAIDAPAESVSVIRRAVGLLPRRPPEVRVVGAEGVAPADRGRFLESEAFVSTGRGVVYLTGHSPVLKGARDGSSDHVFALAAIIWHEMAHLDGADEPEAQRREERLWTRFIRDHRVDRAAGLRYLKAMHDRRR